jgi:hypothetical protein
MAQSWLSLAIFGLVCTAIRTSRRSRATSHESWKESLKKRVLLECFVTWDSIELISLPVCIPPEQPYCSHCTHHMRNARLHNIPLHTRQEDSSLQSSWTQETRSNLDGEHAGTACSHSRSALSHYQLTRYRCQIHLHFTRYSCSKWFIVEAPDIWLISGATACR